MKNKIILGLILTFLCFFVYFLSCRLIIEMQKNNELEKEIRVFERYIKYEQN